MGSWVVFRYGVTSGSNSMKAPARSLGTLWSVTTVAVVLNASVRSLGTVVFALFETVLKAPVCSLGTVVSALFKTVLKAPARSTRAPRCALPSLTSLALSSACVGVLRQACGPFQSTRTEAPRTSPANCGARSLRSLRSSSLTLTARGSHFVRAREQDRAETESSPLMKSAYSRTFIATGLLPADKPDSWAEERNRFSSTHSNAGYDGRPTGG